MIGLEEAEIERVFREVYGQAVATVTRTCGDLSAAEDAVQYAFAEAAERWPVDGVPPNPAGWIITVARNNAIDVHRRRRRGAEIAEAHLVGGPEEENPVTDDLLRLVFTCCHPSLALESRVALTLRVVGGLSVADIARAFLVNEDAMAKRLVRAKYKIRAAGIPYRVPSSEELNDRLQSVLAVVYLIFNVGLDKPDQEVLRGQAIRMGRTLAFLMPDQPEVIGLLALMLLIEARVGSRFVGETLVLLKDQDRTRWDRGLVMEGQDLVRACIWRGRPGPYQLQAAIQAVHCDADRFEDTDWDQIAILYDQLMVMAPTPVVALNRAVAIGETRGPLEALAAMDELSPTLDDYHLLASCRGIMLRRLGREEEAIEAFRRAHELAPSDREKQLLERRIAGHE